MNAIEAYQRYASHTEYADGVLYPHSQAVRRLLEHATVMHTQLVNTQLVKEVQATQKMQSPSTGPVANVDQVVPLPKPLAATLHTPETHVAAGAKQTGHKYTDSGLEIPKAGTIVNPLLLPDLLQNPGPNLASKVPASSPLNTWARRPAGRVAGTTI